MQMGLLENGPVAPQPMPPEPPKKFVQPDDIALQDFLSKDPLVTPGKRRPMLETPFVGACTRCNLSGSLAVDPTDYKTLDRVLEGRVIKADCPRCRKKTEFRPLKPEELVEQQFHIMMRQEEIKAMIFRAAAAKGMNVPDHVKQALDEYMKRMEHALGRRGTMPPAPPTTAPGNIVLPE